jgi:hypothetical protein
MICLPTSLLKITQPKRALIVLLITLAFASRQANTSPSNPLKLELLNSPLSVKFTNTGRETLYLLKPLDGSESCWIMPFYDLSVTDKNGQQLKRGSRCKLFGLYGDMKWPDDYLLALPPGGSYSHPLHLHHVIAASGTHTLRFRYIFKQEKTKMRNISYPSNIWQGEATSNPIKMHLESTGNYR